MLVSLSLILLIFSTNVRASCSFKKHISKVFSFSGVTSVALRELGLLRNPAVKGISVFNPISPSEFGGKRFPGGIFLSSQSFAEFGGGVVLYDESRELSTILDPMSSTQGVEIKTRGLTPLEVTEKVITVLAPFLSSCEKEVSAFRLKTKVAGENLLEMTPAGRSVVYYLGNSLPGKVPEMVIVQDGVVKWLLDQKKIQSYPSPLAYVNWSSKVMRSLPKKTLHIIVKDSGAEGSKDLKMVKGHWNLTYPGSLVPGLTQLEAWNYFEEAASP
jgi:hypothetical protein